MFFSAATAVVNQGGLTPEAAVRVQLGLQGPSCGRLAHITAGPAGGIQAAAAAAVGSSAGSEIGSVQYTWA